MRRPREREKKDGVSEGGLKRSSSVRGRNETKGDAITKDAEDKIEQKTGKNKGKM